VYTDTEDFSKLLVSRLQGDELVDFCLTTSLTLTGVLTPTTWKQAMQSPQKDFWLEAEQKEIEFITKKKVLQPAQLPRGNKLLKTKWVYKVRYGADGELKSYIVRLVACGYAQIFGVDFDETYSPGIRLTSLRVCTDIRSGLRWDV